MNKTITSVYNDIIKINKAVLKLNENIKILNLFTESNNSFEMGYKTWNQILTVQGKYELR